MTNHVNKAFLIPRLCAVLFGTFGLVGVILATLGLYGVVSYSVQSRTREIGVRIALGAKPVSVLSLVIRQGLIIVAAGLVIGLAISAGLSRFLASLLYGVGATDLLTFAGVPLAMLAATLLASWKPARRACSIQPMSALRLE